MTVNASPPWRWWRIEVKVPKRKFLWIGRMVTPLLDMYNRSDCLAIAEFFQSHRKRSVKWGGEPGTMGRLWDGTKQSDFKQIEG